jgi:hypothetical protein
VALRRLLGFCHFLLVLHKTRESRRSRRSPAPVNSGREIPPVLTRRLTCDLAKCPCKIGLTGKIERERNIDKRPVSSHQQCFGALKALAANVTMR